MHVVEITKEKILCAELNPLATAVHQHCTSALYISTQKFSVKITQI
jgi:hypothetical protein